MTDDEFELPRWLYLRVAVKRPLKTLLHPVRMVRDVRKVTKAVRGA